MKKIISTKIIPDEYCPGMIKQFIKDAINRVRYKDKQPKTTKLLEKLEELHQLEKQHKPETTLVDTLQNNIEKGFNPEEVIILSFFGQYDPPGLEDLLLDHYTDDVNHQFIRSTPEFKDKSSTAMRCLWFRARELFHKFEQTNGILKLAELNNISPTDLISTISYTGKPMITLVLLIITIKQIFSSNDFLEDNTITSVDCNEILYTLKRAANPTSEFKLAVLLIKLMPDYKKELLSIQPNQLNPSHLRLEAIENTGVLQKSFVELQNELECYKKRETKSQDTDTYRKKYPTTKLYKLIPALEKQVQKHNPNKSKIEDNPTFYSTNAVKEMQQQITKGVGEISMEFKKEFQEKLDLVKKNYSELSEKHSELQANYSLLAINQCVLNQQHSELQANYSLLAINQCVANKVFQEHLRVLDMKKDQVSKKQAITSKHPITCIKKLEEFNKTSAHKQEIINKYTEAFIEILKNSSATNKRTLKTIEKFKSTSKVEFHNNTDFVFNNDDQNSATEDNFVFGGSNSCLEKADN